MIICTKGGHAMHFVVFVTDPAEAVGPLKLWPGQGAEIEQDIVRYVEQTKAWLAEGRLFAYRVKVIRGDGAGRTAQRHWSIRDALDREVATEPIDAQPIPFAESVDWPATPAIANQRMAA